MARVVTYASFRTTQGYNASAKPWTWVNKPACFTIYRAELHEGPGDCPPACSAEYARVWSHPIQYPHVDCANGETVAIVTPLCTAQWITIELAEAYATPQAPAFDFPGVLEHRAMTLRAHRQYTHPRHCY